MMLLLKLFFHVDSAFRDDHIMLVIGLLAGMFGKSQINVKLIIFLCGLPSGYEASIKWLVAVFCVCYKIES